MRTLNDAVRCSKEIADKDTASDHYRNYIRVLVNSIRYNHVMLDPNGQVLASRNLASSNTYGLLCFSQLKHRQYGLNSVSSVADFDTKIDKAISAMTVEIGL